MSTWLAWLLFLPPWLLLVFLEPERKRRFIPAALLSCLISTILFQMAVSLNWWSVTSNIFYFTHISAFVYGFLPVGALISFYWTYPNPWIYFGFNLVIDALQAYVISVYIFEKAGFYQLTGMNHTGLFALQTIFSIILYAFQMWLERGRQLDNEEVPMARWLGRWFFRTGQDKQIALILQRTAPLQACYGTFRILGIKYVGAAVLDGRPGKRR